MYNISKEYGFARFLVSLLERAYNVLASISLACSNVLALICRIAKNLKFGANLQIWRYDRLQAPQGHTSDGITRKIGSHKQ